MSVQMIPGAANCEYVPFAQSGADILTFQPAGLAVGRTATMIGFFQFTMRLGHDYILPCRCILKRKESIKLSFASGFGKAENTVKPPRKPLRFR